MRHGHGYSGPRRGLCGQGVLLQPLRHPAGPFVTGDPVRISPARTPSVSSGTVFRQEGDEGFPLVPGGNNTSGKQGFLSERCLRRQRSIKKPPNPGAFFTQGKKRSQSRTPWNSMSVISYVTRPRGMSMVTSSPTSWPSRARPTGELMEMEPLAKSASSGPSRVN